MKKKDFEEIKNKETAELKKELEHHRDRLRALKFDLSAGKVKNVREIRSVKKSIAQILTLVSGRKHEKRS